MEALRQYNARVPEDVSIIGCDGSILCSYVIPSLTTIRTHMHQLGVDAANEVLRLIAREDGKILRIPCTIIVRQSCAIRR